MTQSKFLAWSVNSFRRRISLSVVPANRGDSASRREMAVASVTWANRIRCAAAPVFVTANCRESPRPVSVCSIITTALSVTPESFGLFRLGEAKRTAPEPSRSTDLVASIAAGSAYWLSYATRANAAPSSRMMDKRVFRWLMRLMAAPSLMRPSSLPTGEWASARK